MPPGKETNHYGGLVHLLNYTFIVIAFVLYSYWTAMYTLLLLCNIFIVIAGTSV